MEPIIVIIIIIIIITIIMQSRFFFLLGPFGFDEEIAMRKLQALEKKPQTTGLPSFSNIQQLAWKNTSN